ncbi:MAG: hypothetical protein MI892_22075 [Desulfobacterales bacterium]|nr:hypothetical protein [Desulfobacterales bacterium]
MPSRLGRNLRKGHLAEDIGISALRAFSAVADVRHQDDIGVDAYCVLLRPENQLLFAEDPFSVQFKAASIQTIKYNTSSINWFTSLQIPLFFGRVDVSTGVVLFYTASKYREQLYKVQEPSEIVLNFDSEESFSDEKKINVGLHPPIMACDERSSRTDKFAAHAYSHFKKWISFEKRAIELQRFNIHITPKWEWGGEPNLFFTGSRTRIPERIEHMESALPIIDKLAFHAMGTSDCDPNLLKAFIRVFRWFEEQGFNSEDLPINILSSTMNEWKDLQ